MSKDGDNSVDRYSIKEDIKKAVTHVRQVITRITALNFDAAVIDRFAHRIVNLAHYFIDQCFKKVWKAAIFILDILDQLLYNRHVFVIKLVGREDAENFG